MAWKDGTTAKPWRASWFDIEGHRRSKVFRYKADAEAYEREQKRTRQRARGTLAEWLDAGGRDRVLAGLAPSTIATYRGHLTRRIVPDLGGWQIAAITPDAIERCRDQWLTSGLSPSAVAGTMNCLARVFRTLVKARLLDRSPMDEADRPTLPTPQHVQALDPGDVARLAAEVSLPRPDGIDRQCYADYVQLAGYTGLRAGELAALAPEAVSLRDGLITVRAAVSAGVHRQTTKSGHVRHVPILDSVRPILTRLLAEHRGPQTAPLLRGPLGGVWNHSNFLDSVDWPRMVARLGIPGLRFHDLRGTAITLWIRAGIPLTTVRAMAGHASLATTDLYARAVSGDLSQAVNLANSYMSRYIEGRDGE